MKELLKFGIFLGGVCLGFFFCFYNAYSYSCYRSLKCTQLPCSLFSCTWFQNRFACSPKITKALGKAHASLPLVNKSSSDNSSSFSKQKFKFLLYVLAISVLKLHKNSSLKGNCLAFQCLRTAPVPFHITSPLVKSCIPLVSPLQRKTVLCSMEQITQESHRTDLVTSTRKISTPLQVHFFSTSTLLPSIGGSLAEL